MVEILAEMSAETGEKIEGKNTPGKFQPKFFSGGWSFSFT